MLIGVAHPGQRRRGGPRLSHGAASAQIAAAAHSSPSSRPRPGARRPQRLSAHRAQADDVRKALAASTASIATNGQGMGRRRQPYMQQAPRRRGGRQRQQAQEDY